MAVINGISSAFQVRRIKRAVVKIIFGEFILLAFKLILSGAFPD
jgi:hypothetical protein